MSFLFLSPMCACVFGPLGSELTSSTKFSDLLEVCVLVHDSSDDAYVLRLSRLKLPTSGNLHTRTMLV